MWPAFYIWHRTCKCDCERTLYRSVYPLRPCSSPSVCVCVGDGLYMYVEVFQAPVCICSRTYSPQHVNTHTCIMTKKYATKRTNNYCLPVFTGSCYRVCVRNPIIPQRVLSAASWKSAAELRGCFSCVGEFARMYTCALNTSAPIQPSFLHLLLRAKKIPPELYESGQIIINPMTLKVRHTQAQASTAGRSIQIRSKLILMAVCLFESQLKSKLLSGLIRNNILFHKYSMSQK